MVVPRRRSTLSPPIEPSKDTTPTEVVFEDEGNDADVIEQIGGKTVSYSAKVKKKDEAKDQEQDFSHEDQTRFTEEPPIPTIPQSPLDKLFESIAFAIEYEGVYDSFIAKLLRKPDNMNDKFNVPCRDFYDVGAFSFCSTDRFSFMQAIQDANDNSGGRFSISIFTNEYKSLYSMYNRSEQAAPVAADIVVPNPKVKTEIEHSNNGGMDSTLLTVLNRMADGQAAILRQLAQPAQKSELESMLMAAMVQKFSNDLVNPPNNNNGGVNNSIERVMESVAVTQAMAEGFARIINREPPTPPQPTIIDKAREVMELPMVKELGGRILEIADAAAIHKLKLDTTEPNTANPQGENNTMSEQQELITTVLTELESENALNAENQTIIELSEDFPDALSDLIVTCKTAPFETVFSLLLNRAGKMQPFPFTQYLNVEETQKEQRYIWNESGEKIIVRLRELYDYLKTVQ